MLYTTAKQEDIKVYGKLVPATEDNIVTEAKYVYDDVLGMSQADINTTLDPSSSASTRKDNTWTGNNTFDGDVEFNGAVKLDSLDIPTINADDITAKTVTSDEVTAKVITVDKLNCASYAPESIETTTVKADEVTAGTGKFTTLEADSISPDAVTANTVTTATLNVTGESTVDDITVGGNATISGDTTIGGVASISGDATINGNTTVGGSATINGDATVSGNLTVSGDATLDKGFSSTETTDEGKYTGAYDAKGINLEDTINEVSSIVDASQAKFTSGDNALAANATSLTVTDGTATNAITSASSTITSGNTNAALTPTALTFTDSSTDPATTITFNKSGITKSNGSATTVLNTNGGTVDMDNYASLIKDNVYSNGTKQTFRDPDSKYLFVIAPYKSQFYAKSTLSSGRYYEYDLVQGKITYSLRESNTQMRDVVEIKPSRILMQYGYPDYPTEDTGYRLKLETAPSIKMYLAANYTKYNGSWNKNTFSMSDTYSETDNPKLLSTKTVSVSTAGESPALAFSYTKGTTNDVYNTTLNASVTPSLTLKKTTSEGLADGSYYVDNTLSKWDTALSTEDGVPLYYTGSDSAKTLEKRRHILYMWGEDTPPSDPDSQFGLHFTTSIAGSMLKSVSTYTDTDGTKTTDVEVECGAMLSNSSAGLIVKGYGTSHTGTSYTETASVGSDYVTLEHREGSNYYKTEYGTTGFKSTNIPNGLIPINLQSIDNKTLQVSYLAEDTTDNAPAHYDVKSSADYIKFQTPILEHVRNSLYTNSIALDKQVFTTNSDATTKATSLTATSVGLEYYKHIEEVDGISAYYTRKSTIDSDQQCLYMLPSQTTDPDDPDSVAGAYKVGTTTTGYGVITTWGGNNGTTMLTEQDVKVGLVNEFGDGLGVTVRELSSDGSIRSRSIMTGASVFVESGSRRTQINAGGFTITDSTGQEWKLDVEKAKELGILVTA